MKSFIAFAIAVALLTVSAAAQISTVGSSQYDAWRADKLEGHNSLSHTYFSASVVGYQGGYAFIRIGAGGQMPAFSLTAQPVNRFETTTGEAVYQPVGEATASTPSHNVAGAVEGLYAESVVRVKLDPAANSLALGFAATGGDQYKTNLNLVLPIDPQRVGDISYAAETIGRDTLKVVCPADCHQFSGSCGAPCSKTFYVCCKTVSWTLDCVRCTASCDVACPWIVVGTGTVN